MTETSNNAPKPTYRPRKAHKKSRNGCARCKQRKTKCDEVIPRCSRCAKRGLVCQYWLPSGSELDSKRERRLMPRPEDSSRRRPRPVGSTHGHAIAAAGSLPSICSLYSPEISDTVHQLHSSTDKLFDRTELQLLGHYLTHTSRIIPFDRDDAYALQVGIPNLAFHSKPLMSSIIALAAVCHSHDLLGQPQQDRARILDLLTLAEKHHSASLLQVQRDISKSCEFDYVLANATLMVLYASASHCVRIRLAETQTKDKPLPPEFMPAQSQWISLIRAAHLAFVGLLNDRSETGDVKNQNTKTSPTITLLPNCSQAASIHGTIFPQDGPAEKTKDILFPILATSSGPALTALHAKARAIRKAERHTSKPNKSAVEDVSLEACFGALEILSGIMTEVFSAEPTTSPISTCSPQSHLGPDFPSLGRLSTVPGWLQSYVARVTSCTTAPRPLRRVIMAFLNRVPAEYLRLVQTTLDSTRVQTDSSQQDSWEISEDELSNFNVAHKLALEIFAHWTVLVMLLDGVWWIGGIGAWELGRLVSFIRGQGWLDSTYTARSWWPESMYIVGRELKKSENHKVM
ncbi:hypothetical protein BP5796_13233 [Coleophoma crateriformis]|uniref:Zn(2)-C6 fungal-type domain-containing protein n=1 Tax=Coleophoma crateriformis TaxID=565419 RepID=A0A3D8Q3Z0_9HELO|nr:hypothetical protein BP5796_13233 [Coleophoma crateriformis]